MPTVSYRGKVKLDGTNAGVRVKRDGQVIAQSRSRDLGTGDDNYGFSTWVEENREYWSQFAEERGDVVFFGEWCGKGIQKRTAVSKVDKMFCVFAMQATDGYSVGIHFDPRTIERALSSSDTVCPGLRVIPWQTNVMAVDYMMEGSVDNFVERVNGLVEEVEACDPWVRDTFGIEGLGEGLVFYPVSYPPHLELEMLVFKAKGEEHQEVRQPKPALKDPEVVASIEAFTAKFVTRQRCEQAVVEGCRGERDLKMTGPFLKWVGGDIRSESEAELESAGLTWRAVSKEVSRAACDWWMRECEG